MKHLHLLFVAVLFSLLAGCMAAPDASAPTTGAPNPTTAVSEATPMPTAGDPTAEVGVPTSDPTPTGGGDLGVPQLVDDETVLPNIPYRVASLDNQIVSLSNGVFEDPATMTNVSYVGPAHYADVNGDGKRDAIVVLVTTTGGSDMFSDLAVVATDANDTPINIATIALGTWVTVRDVSVTDGMIVVTMLTPGPNEPLCCGTLPVSVTYIWADDSLTEVARSETGHSTTIQNFYDVTAFSGMTIRSTLIPSGTVTLTNGQYTSTADGLNVVLDTSVLQYADLNGDGQEEAVLLLHIATGANERFTELVVAGVADNRMVELASTVLGESVTVYGVMLINNQHILVDLLSRSPADAACCPTRHINAEFVWNGTALEPGVVTEVETIPAPGSSGLTPESVTMELNGVADSIAGRLVPYQPLPTAPHAVGAPEHLLFEFNGASVTGFSPVEAQLLVLPVAQYEALYANSGNSLVLDYITALHQQLAVQSTTVSTDFSQPLPSPPLFYALQELGANIKYVNFNGGTGYRFIAHYGQGVAPTPFISGEVFYTYQGLTADGAYLVVLLFPLQTDLLPATYDDVPQDVWDGINNGMGYEAYRQATLTTLDSASSEQFTPSLDALDAMIASITLTPEVAE